MTMPSTTLCNFGDVVLVRSLSTSLRANKKRPAVVISGIAYQQNRPDVILMAITSQIRLHLNIGEQLLQDWQAAGVVKPSLIKPIITTVEQARPAIKYRLAGCANQVLLGETLGSVLYFAYFSRTRRRRHCP